MSLCYRLMVIAGQPSLSNQLRGLVWEWLIHWPWESSSSEDGLSDGDALNHSQEYEAELKKLTLKTSVFDSNGEYIERVILCNIRLMAIVVLQSPAHPTVISGRRIIIALLFLDLQTYFYINAKQGAYPISRWTMLQVGQ